MTDQADARVWALMCELKTAAGGSTSSLVQVCVSKSGAERLAKARSQGLSELFEMQVGDSGMKVSSLLRDLGIVGVNHQILGNEPKDPGLIEEVKPKLVVLHS